MGYLSGRTRLVPKTMAMLFFNPSLRTRLSFICALAKLGGTAIDLPLSATYPFEFTKGAVMDKDKIEHVKDAVKVISSYVDVIGIRASKLVTSGKDSAKVDPWEKLKQDQIIKSFMEYATVPVINMESNVWHPCQGLADAVTIVEKLALKTPLRKKYILTWVPHPKALPVATPNSQLLSACDLGMEVKVVCPEGFELDQEIMLQAEKRAVLAGGTLGFTNEQYEALNGADFVCAKSWGALKYYGNWEAEKKIRDGLKNWIVDQEKMKLTNDAYFMHCLPVRRNVEVADEVIDGPKSLVYIQAENRMWAQMAILLTLLI